LLYNDKITVITYDLQAFGIKTSAVASLFLFLDHIQLYIKAKKGKPGHGPVLVTEGSISMLKKNTLLLLG
jgi:hypothetical protein